MFTFFPGAHDYTINIDMSIKIQEDGMNGMNMTGEDRQSIKSEPIVFQVGKRDNSLRFM